MKKILVISANPAPPIQAGNQKCIIEYCNLLHNIGCEVYFLYIEGRQKAPIEMFNYWGEKLFVYKKQLQKDIIKRTLIVLRAKLLGYNHCHKCCLQLSISHPVLFEEPTEIHLL